MLTQRCPLVRYLHAWESFPCGGRARHGREGQREQNQRRLSGLQRAASMPPAAARARFCRCRSGGLSGSPAGHPPIHYGGVGGSFYRLFLAIE